MSEYKVGEKLVVLFVDEQDIEEGLSVGDVVDFLQSENLIQGGRIITVDFKGNRVPLYPNQVKLVNTTVPKEDRFTVGQKVLCISSVGYLAEDQMYTVSKAVYTNELSGITVEECDVMNGYSLYKACRFEPLVKAVILDSIDIDTIFDVEKDINESQTDCEKSIALISVLNKILTQIKSD